MLSDITPKLLVTMCSWSLSTYCDPLQFYDELPGLSKIVSTFILDTKLMKLKILYVFDPLHYKQQ